MRNSTDITWIEPTDTYEAYARCDWVSRTPLRDFVRLCGNKKSAERIERRMEEASTLLRDMDNVRYFDGMTREQSIWIDEFEHNAEKNSIEELMDMYEEYRDEVYESIRSGFGVDHMLIIQAKIIRFIIICSYE